MARGTRVAATYSLSLHVHIRFVQLQKDLFPPRAADSYLPAVNQATRHAVEYADKVERFSELAPLAAMDLFMSVALGYSPMTTSSLVPATSKADPLDLVFAQNAMVAMSHLGYICIRRHRCNLSDVWWWAVSYFSLFRFVLCNSSLSFG